jgi:hypothetical protein
MRSSFSNAYHASAEGFSGSTVMAKDTKTLLVMECPTHGTWFASFVCGCHKRMGNIVKPDRAVFLEVIHHIIKMVDNDWVRAPRGDHYKYAREGCFYLVAFCGAL